jgi:hypothetical protein
MTQWRENRQHLPLVPAKRSWLSQIVDHPVVFRAFVAIGIMGVILIAIAEKS